MLLAVQYLLGNYQKTENACKRTDGRNESCDAMALGSLLKATQKARLWPFPKPPYNGFTVEGLKEAFLAVEIKTLCDITHPAHGLEIHEGKYFLMSSLSAPYNQQVRICANNKIEESMRRKILDSLSDGLCGLKIEDFK
jgi:hypothetical protein